LTVVVADAGNRVGSSESLLKQDLATMLGMQPPTVTLVMGTLQDGGRVLRGHPSAFSAVRMVTSAVGPAARAPSNGRPRAQPFDVGDSPIECYKLAKRTSQKIFIRHWDVYPWTRVATARRTRTASA